MKKKSQYSVRTIFWVNLTYQFSFSLSLVGSCRSYNPWEGFNLNARSTTSLYAWYCNYLSKSVFFSRICKLYSHVTVTILYFVIRGSKCSCVDALALIVFFLEINYLVSGFTILALMPKALNKALCFNDLFFIWIQKMLSCRLIETFWDKCPLRCQMTVS